jgi:hypothetical protein
MRGRPAEPWRGSTKFVMAGLDPAICRATGAAEDGRDKPSHDVCIAGARSARDGRVAGTKQ